MFKKIIPSKSLKYLITILFFLTLVFVFFQNQKNNMAPFDKILNWSIFQTSNPFFEMPDVPNLNFPDKICNIIDYGAIGDGEFSNTEIIRGAISDCARNGGGVVSVPAGKWVTGPINLKSNINLRLEEGAEILFSKNFSDYLPVVFTRFEGIELYNYSPLIYTKDCENVAITGKGKLNGQGAAWWEWEDVRKNLKNIEDDGIYKLSRMGEQQTPVENRLFGKPSDFLRPSMVQFINCKGVLIENVEIVDGPMWTIHLIYSENALIKKIRIISTGPNTDGIVVDSSKNIIVDGPVIDSGDDAIVIKSGKNTDGLRVNKPSENIEIHNCNILTGHSGIAIGSEMSGGVKNVSIENCNMDRVDFGIRMKSMRGRGGVVENIWINNIEMRRADEQAIVLDMQYGTPEDELPEKIPSFRKISFQNINCKRTHDAIILNGLPNSPINDISFKNININSVSGITKSDVINDKFKNVDINKKKD